MTKPYKAKFRVVLKDRYAQSVGFWGQNIELFIRKVEINQL